VSKPYDVTTKFLLQSRPLDWLRFFGLDATEVEIVDAEFSWGCATLRIYRSD
jgi:hypothetical protein